jgi:hypothetical protein
MRNQIGSPDSVMSQQSNIPDLFCEYLKFSTHNYALDLRANRLGLRTIGSTITLNDFTHRSRVSHAKRSINILKQLSSSELVRNLL